MSRKPNQASPRDDRSLAGELALGVLTGAELAAAEKRRRDDPDFARAVEEWHVLLADLALEAPEVAPPAANWAETERRLFGAQAASPGLWHNLALWRWLAAGSTAAALALAALVIVPLTAPRTPQPPPLVATLQAADAGPAFIARYHAEIGRLVIRVVKPADAAARVPELWLIPKADGVPRSLGLLALTGETGVTIPQALRPHAAPGATLAVSLEPPGGAPGGKPTGPVVALGEIGAF